MIGGIRPTGSMATNTFQETGLDVYVTESAHAER